MKKITDHESVLNKLNTGDKIRAKFKTYFKSPKINSPLRTIPDTILSFKSIPTPEPINWRPAGIIVIIILTCLLVLLSLVFINNLEGKTSTRITPQLAQPVIRNYYITPTITNNITQIKEKVVLGANHSCVKYEYGDDKQFYLECDVA